MGHIKKKILYFVVAMLSALSAFASGNTTYNNTISCVTQSSKSIGLGALFAGLVLFCIAMTVLFVVVGKDDV